MTGGTGSAGGMGGWSGPGAKSSVRNAAETQQYKDLKRRLEAEEQEKRDVENARRESLGQKPREFCSLFLLV